jgi:hypothetical protein
MKFGDRDSTVNTETKTLLVYYMRKKEMKDTQKVPGLLNVYWGSRLQE